jgi:hypothetical protein
MLNAFKSVLSGKNKLFLFLMLLMLTGVSKAQWQPDVRLTNNAATSYTSLNNARCVVANGDSVYVVWYDERDGNAEIYYKRSTDGGVSWGVDTRLTNNTSISQSPSVSVFSSVIHVVWQDNRDGGNHEIYYKRSTDGGINWGTDTRLTNATNNSRLPSVSVSNSVVHVVWEDLRDGNYEIYYKRSTDGGVSWDADTRLTNDPANSLQSSVSVSISVVHVVWMDQRDGDNPEIYYKRSTDGGANWGADTKLTNNSDFSVYPSVTVSGSVVHVVWYDTRDGDHEIYYKRSTDGGANWGADTRLTNNPGFSVYPSVSVSGLIVHVAWKDQRDGNYEIYYKRSADGGISWGADTRLTNNSSVSENTSISSSGSVVHVVWRDWRDGNEEIYYKRDPSGNIVGIINTNWEIPEQFSLSQNYPNPFNPVTVISYKLAVSSFTSLKIYDVLGKEAATLVNQSQLPGTYEVEFDGSNLGSGIYYYKLTSGDFTETRKAVLIK